ncbi:MAG: hypothetical protein JST37_05370 [Bacteroidetes bacterium]|nr:hypothetical protein [Bacteroidota bacterium]MBS1981170.1 hypothetical protein [Bacteroidota bacterium]
METTTGACLNPCHLAMGRYCKRTLHDSPTNKHNLPHPSQFLIHILLSVHLCSYHFYNSGKDKGG